MAEGQSYRGSPLWDWRRHNARSQYFKTAEGEERDDVKRRALTVLRSYAYGTGSDEPDIEGQLWALQDINRGDALKSACLWFQAAAAYSEESTRKMLCMEAYGKIERALRCYL